MTNNSPQTTPARTGRSAPKRPKQGRYLHLPLPTSWKGLLSILQPAPKVPTLTPTAHPEIGHVFDAHLGTVKPRDQLLLFQRYGQGKSVEALSALYEVSTQAIYTRQLQIIKAVRHVWPETLEALVLSLCPYDTSWLDFAGASSALFPQANSDELWNTLYGLHQFFSPNTYTLHTRLEGGWLLRQVETPNLKRARHIMKTTRALITPEHLAQQSGCTERSLLSAVNLGLDMILTRNHQLALKSWNVKAWSTIVAQELAQHGITEFHFSEMARALEFILPERFPDLSGHYVSTILAHSRDVFSISGRTGYWQLNQYSDGHANTGEAICAVLAAASEPIGPEEIHKLLKRNVPVGTITQIMSTHPEIKRVGTRRYILNRPGLPTHVTEAFRAEEALLAQLFAQARKDTLPQDIVNQAALRANLDPLRVELSTRVSQAHIYTKRHRSYVLADSHALLVIRFMNWYGQRGILLSPPQPELIFAGLHELQRERRSKQTRGTWARRIQNTRSLFTECGWPFPTNNKDSTPGNPGGVL